MEIHTILYINIFLLTGYAIGLAVIALHNPRYRQILWLAVAYLMGAVGVVIRIGQGHIPDFISLVMSNVLVMAGLLLTYRCFARFLRARTGSWPEVLILTWTIVGVAYYTYIRPSFGGRTLVISVAVVCISALSVYVLIRYAEAAVRTPCISTASLFAIFVCAIAVQGVSIAVRGTPGDFFSSAFVHLLEFLGFDVLIAGVPLGYFWMTSARLYANQEQLARTDSLTGLPNRRALEEHALREMERSRRNRQALAVLAVDIDHFKYINDQYGHEVGDAALGAVAKALAEALRKQDVLARFGGEEFVVLLPDTGVENGMETAQRLRVIVEELDIIYESRHMNVTASFGVALLDAEDTFEMVLRRADRAMYAAKLAGRNRVMLESDFLYLPDIEARDAYHRSFDTAH